MRSIEREEVRRKVGESEGLVKEELWQDMMTRGTEEERERK